MQSSSQLFPVQLLSAELIGSLYEDVYLLKPNNSADRSVELAVTRISNKETHELPSNGHGQPVILLHGSFSNRRHWLSAEGEGVAAFLVEAGYDVWLPEMRGHGLSPVNQDYSNNSLDRVIEYDLPAIQKFVVEQTGKKVIYIAEELGGFSVLGSLALGAIDQSTVSGCIYIEEEIPLSIRLNTRLFAKNALWRFRKGGVVNGQTLGIGTENETYSTIKEYLRWYSKPAFKNPAGLLLENAYREIAIPVLVVGRSSADDVQSSKNARWIFNELMDSVKAFREYDYSTSYTSKRYSDGGITLFPNEGGCWDDILLWLDSRQAESHFACSSNIQSKTDKSMLVTQ